ncbi:505_t:CDS:2, partial [Gigaspora rosea]
LHIFCKDFQEELNQRCIGDISEYWPLCKAFQANSYGLLEERQRPQVHQMERGGLSLKANIKNAYRTFLTPAVW